jgi:hypothetical protein
VDIKQKEKQRRSFSGTKQSEGATEYSPTPKIIITTIVPKTLKAQKSPGITYLEK